MNKLTALIFAAAIALPLSAQAAPASRQSGDVIVKANGETRNLSQEERNRRLVLDFYDRVFNKHDLVEAPKIIGDDFIQHNPGVPDGRQGFIDRLKPIFEKSPQRGSRFIRSAAQGDLVWVHVHSTEYPGDRGRAIMDIFRVKNGKIVEHWDVVQPIPENPKNNNGMF